jgi:hypothetical protein
MLQTAAAFLKQTYDFLPLRFFAAQISSADKYLPPLFSNAI